MANYPQLDDQVGVWKLKEVNDAVMGGYWRVLSGSVGRALNAGGFTPGYSSVIEQIQIETSGNSTFFGDLSVAGGEFGAIGTPTRMVFLGRGIEASPNTSNILDYVTIATTGNAADFGDMSGATQRTTGVGGNATRGVFTEGTVDINGMEYITPTSTGNTITFGDMTVSGSFRSGVTSPTRVCFAEGFTPSVSNVIDFIEIATTGNAVDFGDLTSARRAGSGLSSSTRGVFAGGITPGALSGLEFITIASQGNAIDYGDLVSSNNKECDSTSNSVRGIVAGGHPAQNVIQQFNIATGGSTTDFGDLLSAKNSCALNSGSHGGLNNGYEGTRIRPLNEAGGDVGMFAGGSPDLELIQTINISSTGNANKFGDLSTGRRQFAGGFSNKTRSLTANGYDGGSPGYPSVIEYVEFATQGNSANFGDTSAGSETGGSMATNTRGVFSLGVVSPAIVNTVEYVTFASLGNAADFGNATVARNNPAGLSSNTRGVLGGGANPSLDDVIDYITISTTGNSTDFGNLTVARKGLASSGSPTRGVFLGGASPNTSTANDTIDYITIATTGNATDFGNLVTAKRGLHGSVASNSVRGTIGAGATPSTTEVIEFITIASTGNASDFGDLMVSTNNVAASANGHGGLVGG